MKESKIRKNAIEILKAQGWVCWFPSKVRFQETDIFGILDLACWRKNKMKFIQLTTTSNMSARRKKMRTFMDKHGVSYPSIELWGWHNDKKFFKVEKIK